MDFAGPDTAPLTHEALAWAHPVTQEWFLRKFGSPTEPQIAGWPVILRGETTLISAPTGSGKTLAAFLVCIDTLLRAALEGRLTPATHVVYISPLKALSNDVQKNLEGPLREIRELALERGFLCPEIRTGVRTGDTLQKERTAMLKHPPHILVTTPESLYILLTAAKPREHLRRVTTVIVDEIHAVAPNKRGSHLAITLERLDALVCGENRLSPGTLLTGLQNPPQRIGLSATQNPIELIAEFLAGTKTKTKIVQVGQRRTLDLAIEVPSDELGSITTIAMREEMYDKLAALALEHRSTLVFVNTRSLVEKISFELSERLGSEAVAAHHGSLSRIIRLDAEQRLKNGEIRILVATASLELGIDIGNVDLVCQVATTRNIGVAMQRVGRAGHWRGAVPKGRFFALTRDDLIEQAALLRKMTRGELDLLEIPPEPIDVLMQQIVAMCGAESWDEDALFSILTRAQPYQSLTRKRYDEVLGLLHTGIENSRARYGAYILRDRIQGQLHGRRGSRMIAIGNGGAIPDTSLFSVMLQPENVQIATLDEHFAVDSSPGDVVLLGNTSWRIQRIDPAGKVLVEDAHGASPSVPFWEGEAPQRTSVLSDGVSELREEIGNRTRNSRPSDIGRSSPEIAACIQWLRNECFVTEPAAMQMVTYIVHGRAVLGAIPTKRRIIAERFFDEGGGQQLILHAPFGGRVNKAWGLALRKRFCRGFNFELQAAATDNGINISLAEQHSFPLIEVFQFLSKSTARNLLEQASIPSPLFKNRWRWAASRSLQLLRMQKGKRVAPQIQRSRSDDLLASVFPHASACPETMTGDMEIPDHPLVDEVMRDTLSEAMDIEGLEGLLQDLASGAVECLAVDSPIPSHFAHELINAMPYSFLDPEDAAARRTRTVTLRKALPDTIGDGAGKLDLAAIDTVRRELFPDVRDENELHDLLLNLLVLPLAFVADRSGDPSTGTRHWLVYFSRLEQQGRAFNVELRNVRMWIAAESLDNARFIWPEAMLPEVLLDLTRRDAVITGTEERPAQTLSQRDSATMTMVQGWLQVLGPTTAGSLGELLRVDTCAISQSLLAMEMQGLALRGAFERPAQQEQNSMEVEWCERRILQRIHRLTLSTLRRQTEPVNAQVYMRWLFDWQHTSISGQRSGEEGVLAVIEQLEGFEAPAIEWERTILPARIHNYDPIWLDNLCLAGILGWARFSPHPAWTSEPGRGPTRVVPTSAAPITFYLRESAEWVPEALRMKSVSEAALMESLSAQALRVRGCLKERGAAFSADLQKACNLAKHEVMAALWELATAGLASADGFDPLRAMMDPRRKAVAVEQTAAVSLRKRAAARTTTGRWSLLSCGAETVDPLSRNIANATEEQRARAIAAARRTDAALDAQARILLCRYGVLFRELLTRESNAPKWRDLVPVLRRLEARGEIRGGRFVSGAFGEQFAMAEAVDGLRAARKQFGVRQDEEPMTVAAADPLNLVGIIVPGERQAAVPGKMVAFRNGLPVVDGASAVTRKGKRARSVVDVVREAATVSRPAPTEVLPTLFS